MHASSVCPVCNGFSALRAVCPICGTSLRDAGRVMDLYGNYSPYRPIDDLKMTDGMIDLSTHDCPHQVWCQKCGFSEVRMIREINV
jgi:hypothetical protein